jgi:predicted nucleic acid-binding protein
LTLVLDASAVVSALTVDDGFVAYGGEALRGPPLLWSEARSVLHVGLRRGQLEQENALLALELLENGPVQPASHPQLGYEAWRIADGLGWAKTYDAEYLALARLLRCDLVTFDRRLQAAAGRLGVATRRI